MATLINLAIAIIVIGLIVGLLVWAIKSLTIIPEPIKQIGVVLIVLVACLILLGVVFGHIGGLHFVSVG
jgi:hypothetical protein